eukprot:1072155-Pleurochrysis_carterae.AAC.1
MQNAVLWLPSRLMLLRRLFVVAHAFLLRLAYPQARFGRSGGEGRKQGAPASLSSDVQGSCRLQCISAGMRMERIVSEYFTVSTHQ